MQIEQTTEQVLRDRFGLTASDVEQALDVAKGGNPGAYVDIFFEDGITETMTLKSGILENVAFDEVNGVGVYVVIEDKEGFAFADNVTRESLLLAASEASVIAKHGKHCEPVRVGGPSPRPHNLYPFVVSPTSIALTEKLAMMRLAEAEARKYDPRVAEVTTFVEAEDKMVIIADTANGININHDRRPLVRMKIDVIAQDGQRRETGSGGGGGRDEFALIAADTFWKKHARSAAKGAVDKLTAAPAPAGKFKVVLGAGWPGVLIHEAVGHGLEGDFNRMKTSAFSGRIGERVASKGVTIIDDGTMQARRGTLNIDDQGVPTGRTVLIEDGILKGYLQDRKNAALMKAGLTGNGRRQSYKHKPMPRMTNTFMAGGQHSLEEMIAAVDDGIYAVQFRGGMVDITSGKFTFEVTTAYRIRQGKIAEALGDATLIGDGPTALTKILMIGNESEVLDAGIGTCGKNMQSVPVCVGMPSCLIDEVTVGGTGE